MQGKNDALVKQFSDLMMQYSEQKKYEDASLVRDKIAQDLDLIDLVASRLDSLLLLVGDPSEYVLPGVFTLDDPYPNPFNPSTSIDFYLGQDAHLNATIYNIHGQVVEVILDETVASGRHQLNWNAKNYSSGLYFLRVQSQNQSKTQKLILIK